MREDSHRRLAAIMAADVAGYSRLMGDDEAATVATLTDYRAVFADHVVRHRGRVVDNAGDSVLAAFDSVVEAVQCALAVQDDLAARNKSLPEVRQMHFRIGVNLGDVIAKPDGTVYGDGVNVAARLESLAPPGGVMVADIARRAVGDKLAVHFHDAGRHAVKNIAEPVHAFRVSDQASGPAPGAGDRRTKMFVIGFVLVLVAFAGAVGISKWRESHRDAATIATDMALDPTVSSRSDPSIAVLPFDNLSGDPEQDYFADGITEDLITDLSKLPGLFVVARNSAFAYKNRATDVRQIARELGVRYVLEGSVRKADRRVRINAQLADADSGGHVWAERYDRELNDIFALQDEIGQEIVDALHITLDEGAIARLAHKETESPAAYDAYLRARAYLFSFSQQGISEARRLAEQAVERDPNYARAFALLSIIHFVAWEFQWLSESDLLQKAIEFGQRAVNLDDGMAEGHTWLGWALLWNKEHDRALAALERAVSLEPNFVYGLAMLGEALNFNGQPERAMAFLQKAIRLDPHYDSSIVHDLGHAYFLLGRHDEAVEAYQDALARGPNFMPAHRGLAATYAELGDTERAKAAVIELLRINPRASLAVWMERLPYRDEATLTRLIAALGDAGIPAQ